MMTLNIDGTGLKAMVAAVSILLALAALGVLATADAPDKRSQPRAATTTTVLEPSPLVR